MPGEAANNQGNTPVPGEWDAQARLIHDLRNGLNSLLMNAAVLAAKLPAAERDGRFARQVQADGERCTALLKALADALRPPDVPPSR